VKRPGSIYVRLIMPLGLTLLVAMIAAWAIAVHLLTDTIDRRLDDQLNHATAMLADGEFPFSPDLIARLDRLIEARIALLDASGEIALSTAHGPANEALHTLVNNISDRRDEPVSLLTAEAGGSTWRIAVRPLTRARDDRFAYVAAAASLDESRQAARDAAKLLAAAMLLVTVLLAWVGHYFTDLTRQSRLAGLGDLASRVAHEIRNPLTTLKMQLQLLEENASPDDAIRIGKLLNEIRRMDMIVESSLTLGAPMTLQRDKVQPDELITDLTELLRPALDHRGIELQIEPQCPAEIDADQNRLRQALLNLINNAADELNDGGIIRVSTAVAPTKDAIEFSVEDSGPGLKETADDKENKKPFGLGLGLSICREIVEQHGGELIAASSTSLGGARFTIRLPVPIIDHDEQSS